MVERPLEIGQTVKLRLDSLAAGGESVGRHEGMAVFAMWGCPGDEAEVGITQVSRRFARGIVRLVIEPSPDRVDPPCPHFGDCGGCQLQHVSYEAQLRHKTAVVRDALQRIGGLTEVEVADTWGMEEPWRYRNRAQYSAAVNESGELTLGFARFHSHEVVALSECQLQHPLSERIRTAIERLLPPIDQGGRERPLLLGVETFVSFSAGRALVTLVCEGQPAFLRPLADALTEDVPEVAGVLSARRRGRAAVHRSPAEVVMGEGHLPEEIGGHAYRVSADSFFQTNPGQAARAVELVKEWAEMGPGETVADLYCGVGTFLLPLAGRARRAFGVEAAGSAVSDGKANARAWGLRNVTFYQRNVERVLPRWVERGRTADVVVLDPPRKGAGPIVTASVAKLKPRRIILVSCDPATLARDLKHLAELGYPCHRLQPIDMFPQTWHVEAVALCDRVSDAPPERLSSHPPTDGRSRLYGQAQAR
jgi:23S rRNA (uracil1939-C5)-methyltransferase